MLRLTLLCLMLVVAGCEPMGPLPGGALKGDVVAEPINWDAVADISTFQLELRPADPYSVNIWGVGVEGSFYVAAGEGSKARWTAYIAENPEVRLRIGNSIYELRAIRVEDDFELRNVRQRYIEKYELSEEDGMAGASWVYRLDPRVAAPVF